MKFKATNFIAFILIGLLTVIGGAQLASAIPIPEVTRPCLPDDNSFFRVTIGDIKLLAQTRYQDVDYYLFDVIRSNTGRTPEQSTFPYVVSGSDQSCDFIYSNHRHEENWLSESMPQPVANQFTLFKYKRFIARYGLDEFKRQLLPSFQRSKAPEDVWALEQLGLSA